MMNLVSLKIVNILIFLMLLTDSFCQSGWERYTQEKIALGTKIKITVYGLDKIKAEVAFNQAWQLLDSLDLIFSDYNIESEVFKMNERKKMAPVAISDPLFELLEISLQIAHHSSGRFDPTLGRLTQLWRQYKSENRLPPRRKVRKNQKWTGYQKVVLNKANQTVLFSHPKIQLDFGGIAKGYIADQIHLLLDSMGLPSHLIDLGGDLVIGQAPPDQSGWSIRFAGCSETLYLHSLAIAGSGPTYQYVENDQDIYSHILSSDAPTGLRNSRVTMVFAQNGTAADAWATAINVNHDERWYEQELIDLGGGYYIQNSNEIFLKHFNNYIRNQIVDCL